MEEVWEVALPPKLPLITIPLPDSDAPYYNFLKVVERFLPILPVRYVLRFHLRTDKWIPNGEMPYLYYSWYQRLADPYQTQ